MSKYKNFDLTYVTIDSLTEGVGSSQIIPLIYHLRKTDIKISLISYEKFQPPTNLLNYIESLRVEWNPRPFGSNGFIGGIGRLNNLRREIPRTNLIHARSDIPAIAGILAGEAPVLWDVRSLWADQKVMIQKSLLNKSLYRPYLRLEGIAASKSVAMSTLTSAVIPILEQRHRSLPYFRTVVPTAVDLDLFQLSPKTPSKFRALFSGTYNDYYDLDLSSLFMEELRKQVVVETDWARPIESNKSSLGVGEERVFSAVQTEMAELIPNYSFGISICKMNAGPSLTAAMPTKIGEFLACGRPVIVNKGLGDMDQFINEYDAGVILDGSSENLTKAASRLIDLISDPETPQRCRALAEKYFSIEVGARKYLDLYSQMLSVNA